MIEKTEILELANLLKLRPGIVEKDYVLGWLLAEINQHRTFHKKWIFKGGTCLKKCYFETYRFSEDLDFTLKTPNHLNSDFLVTVFGEIVDSLYERTGIEIPKDTIKFKVVTNPRGNTSCQGKVGYIGPLQQRHSVARVKLDLTSDEILVLEPQRQRIHHPYSDDPPDGLFAHCYSFEEVFAEKTRALVERARPRDLYDVIHLFRNRDKLNNKKLLRSTLEKKCEFKSVVVPTFQDIESHTKRPELETEWENMLGHQLETLPSLEQFWEELPVFFTWMYEEGEISEPARFSYSGTEQSWTPSRSSVSNYGFIQRIQFAAANRVCIRLRYSGKLRLVEPYSFRTSSEGNQLFYGYHREDRQMKCFRVDRFQSVEVTEKSFSPRYRIEISARGYVSMPSLVQDELAPSRSRTTRSTSRSRSQSSSSGPKYTVQCTVCGKRFKRKNYSTSLNQHKTKQGLPCPGRIGVVVSQGF